MIFGDPRKFAILIEKVDEWSSGTFCEGLFYIYLDCEKLGPTICRSETLNVQINLMLKSFSNKVKNFSKPIFLPPHLNHLQGLELLRSLYKLTYPSGLEEGVENCWDYVISPFSLSDCGYELFIYKNEDQEVLIGGKDFSGPAISVNLQYGSALKIIQDASVYARKITSAH